MQFRVTRIDPALPLPSYGTAGAAAFDLYTRETTVIAPKSLGFIPTNVIVHVPAGHVLLISPRSSTPKKKGLHIPHGVGIIDPDYCGPEDELKFQVWNATDAPVTVERGERVAQAIVIAAPRLEIVETEVAATAASRGGFGTTGS